MKFCIHMLFISVFSMSGIQASESQQKSMVGWRQYILSFFKRPVIATQASKPSMSTLNLSSQEDFFRKAKPVTGYEKSELYSLYRVYDEQALAKFSADFIGLCREYIAIMGPIDLSKETNEITFLKLEKLVLQFEHLALRHTQPILQYRPQGSCLCPTPEDSALQTMFIEIGSTHGIIRSTEGTLKSKVFNAWSYENKPLLSNKIQQDMNRCNSGRPLVQELKTILQKAITRDGVYAPMLQKAINEVIDPYLGSNAGQCK